MSLETRIKKVLDQQAEMKYFDNGIGETTLTAAGVEFGSLAIIPQGLTINSRVGKEIRIKKIMARLNFILAAPTQAADSYDVARIMVIKVRQDADTATGIAARVLSTPATIYSFNNLQTSRGITTLWDEIIVLNCMTAYTSTAGGPRCQYVEWFKEVDFPLVYSGTSGVLAQNEVESLQLVGWSQRSDISVIGTIRLRYTDL